MMGQLKEMDRYPDMVVLQPIKEKKSMLYVIEILRYGNERLGRGLFGVYDDLEKGVAAAKEYNWYRGGKYPTIIVNEFELNEGMPFRYESYEVELTMKTIEN